MIPEFVKAWEEHKNEIEAEFRKKMPSSYDGIVNAVVGIISKKDDYDLPDPDRIHIIDDGHYQGTRLYIIGSGGYQPDKYWKVFVDYGSCSGCDTLERITGYSDGPPDEQQLSDLMSLALHILQNISPL